MATMSELKHGLNKTLKNGNYRESIGWIKSILKYNKCQNILSVLDTYDCVLSIKKKERLSKYSLYITKHAHERMEAYCHKPVSYELMKQWLVTGDVIDYSDLLSKGYRPDKNHRDDTTYIELPNKLIAITIIEDNAVKWITTYNPAKIPRSRIPLTEKQYHNLLSK